MDDLISRSKLKKDLLNRSFYPSIVKNALENAPVVDAVEVVRCRECKYYEIHAPRILENCERNGRLIPMMPDDFCSHGEQREKECKGHIPMTNADRIRAMIDEELAEFLCGVYDNDEDYAKFINGYCIPCYDQHSIKEWLRQPAETREE